MPRISQPADDMINLEFGEVVKSLRLSVPTMEKALAHLPGNDLYDALPPWPDTPGETLRADRYLGRPISRDLATVIRGYLVIKSQAELSRERAQLWDHLRRYAEAEIKLGARDPDLCPLLGQRRL